MTFDSQAKGQMMSGRTGLPITGGSLGTLTSTVAVDRGTASAGPTPTDNGDGTFTIDLSSYTGFAIKVVVSSDDDGIIPYHYADGDPRPLPFDNLTDFSDARAGKICARTGLWVPASRLKYVNGIPFLDEVAPAVYNRPAPDPPGIKQVSSTSDNTPSTGPYTTST